MDFTLVSNQSQLEEMLQSIDSANLVCFDTEFVAEDCYQPDLCLLQISTREAIYIVDPKSVDDIGPVWQVLTDAERDIVVHAGREEILFVYKATGKTMPRLFDVQIAVGLLGGEYPASYG